MALGGFFLFFLSFLPKCEFNDAFWKCTDCSTEWSTCKVHPSPHVHMVSPFVSHSSPPIILWKCGPRFRFFIVGFFFCTLKKTAMEVIFFLNVAAHKLAESLKCQTCSL